VVSPQPVALGCDTATDENHYSKRAILAES